MVPLRQAWARVDAFFRKQALDREFDEELAAHIDLATQDYVREGMSLEEARRHALIRLGGLESARELHREARGLPSLDGIVQDLRFAFRSLRRNPGFTVTAVSMLAIGIGINVAVFTVANAVLFKGFPFIERNDRIVYIDNPKNGNTCCLSYQDLQDWRAQAKSFSGMAAVRGMGVILSDESGFAESYDATQITADTFKLIGQRPILGRDFLPSDEQPGASPVTILSYDFWQRRFAQAPSVIGRSVRINGVPTVVVGVMPQGFSFPQRQDLWMPLARTPELEKREARDWWVAVARLADGATAKSARAEMETIGRRLESAYPLTNGGFIPAVHNFDQFFIGPNAGMIYESMWGAVGFVLLIACANLANLMLARSIGRSREISIRMALGAGRWRIVRQVLIETTMLSALSGVVGWWIARWGVRLYQIAEWPPGSRPWRVLDYTIDHRVLAYLLAVSIGTGLLFGLAPACRLSKLDLNTALKDGGRGATGARGAKLSAILVIGEMALSVVLLAGAGVMMRSFLNIYTAGVGVQANNVLWASMALPDAPYSRAEARINFYARLKTRLEAEPGVESVAIANRLPAGGSMAFPYEFADAPSADDQRRATLRALIVGPGYFHTLGATVLAGREFNDFDSVSGIPVAIVNERFARTSWPGQNPLGKSFRLFDKTTPKPWLTVVGVVSNVVQDFTRQTIDPLVYLPYDQAPAGAMNVIVRTRVPPQTIGTAFRRQVQALDPDLPIYGPFTLADRLVWSYWNSGFYGILFLIFAGTALLLASIGLYALVAHSVGQRTQEIGIRMAIGATARDIVQLVLMQGMLPLGFGLVLGLSASFAVNRVLKSILVHVSPADPVTYLIAAAVLVLSALLGCWIPARRAMCVDPVVTLRHE